MKTGAILHDLEWLKWWHFAIALGSLFLVHLIIFSLGFCLGRKRKSAYSPGAIGRQSSGPEVVFPMPKTKPLMIIKPGRENTLTTDEDRDKKKTTTTKLPESEPFSPKNQTKKKKKQQPSILKTDAKGKKTGAGKKSKSPVLMPKTKTKERIGMPKSATESKEEIVVPKNKPRMRVPSVPSTTSASRLVIAKKAEEQKKTDNLSTAEKGPLISELNSTPKKVVGEMSTAEEEIVLDPFTVPHKQTPAEVISIPTITGPEPDDTISQQKKKNDRSSGSGSDTLSGTNTASRSLSVKLPVPVGESSIPDPITKSTTENILKTAHSAKSNQPSNEGLQTSPAVTAESMSPWSSDNDDSYLSNVN